MDSNFTNETNQTTETQVTEIQPTETATPANEQKGFAIASLVLGICGLLAWCFPCFGYLVTITGLVLGILGLKTGGKNMAIAGIVLSGLSLLFTVINSVAGVILALGQM